MSLPQLPKVKAGATEAETIKNLIGAYQELCRVMEAFMPYIGSENIPFLTTEDTIIRSDRGETEIKGPVLTMYDKQTVPVLRLQMGYDAVSLDFIYRLMNAAGDVTVNIDSNGDLTVERGMFKGSITIGTGDNVFKADSNGIYLGNAVYASAPFKVSMAGAATASNLTITGGSINVDTDVYVGDSIYLTYSTDTNTRAIHFGNLGTRIEGNTDYGLFAYGMVLYAPQISLKGDVNLCVDGSGTAWFNSEKIATEKFVTDKGYITGTTGFTGSKVIGAETYTWSDGVLVSVV